MEKKIESIRVKIVSLGFFVLFTIPGFLMMFGALISGRAGSPIIDLLMRFLFISIGTSLIISTIGLFKYKKWGRFFTLVIAKILFIPMVALSIISLIIGLATPNLILSLFYLIAALFLIFLIYYLTRPKIKEQFK